MEKFIEYLYSKFLLCESVSIDSRTASEGSLFLDLTGQILMEVDMPWML